MGQDLVVAQAIGQGVAVDLAGPFAVLGQDRGRGGAGKVAAHDNLDWQDGHAFADDDIGIGIAKDMVGGDVAGVVEPVAGHLGQDLALEGDRGQDAVKGR